MIECPTTFVVGAGASCAHGLPTGADLLRQARKLTANSTEFQLLHQSGVTLDDLRAFIDRITPTSVRSIDSFLEKRQNEPKIVDTGKAVIAALLGSALYDSRQRSDESNNDWIAHAIEHMHQGAANWEEFARRNSDVRFVTFNFDSVIENRLSKILRTIFDNPTPTDEQIAKVLPVIHAHGRLPPIPSENLFSDSITPFPKAWTSWVMAARTTIRIAYESAPDTHEAREAVRRAHVLCFLGFGYDRGNLDRLGLPDVLAVKPPNATDPCAVFGSAFGLSAGFQAEVKNRLRLKITLAANDDKCEQVIANHHILRG